MGEPSSQAPERGARGAGASTPAGAAGGTAGRAGSAGEEAAAAAATQVAQTGAPFSRRAEEESGQKLLGGKARPHLLAAAVCVRVCACE